jgi:hypothetical protein
MPRHPRIALTSRLRIHTTNDKIGTRCRWGAHGPKAADLITQLDNHVVIDTPLLLDRPASRSAKEESACRHGIDF